MIPIKQMKYSKLRKFLIKRFKTKSYKFNGMVRRYRKRDNYQLVFQIKDSNGIHSEYIDFPQCLTAGKLACYIMRIHRQVQHPHLGQIETSNILGISQATVSKIEKYILEPSLDTWFVFCQEFNVDPVILRADALTAKKEKVE